MLFKVNNQQINTNASAETRLIDFLREELRLTGTKRGCDIGVCGSCTVLINGEPKRSCVVKLSALKDGDEVLTIEGLTPKAGIHPIQQAFVEAGAVQCGFCTPGMILVTKALLDKNPKPTHEEIKKAFSLNICRCTGYQQIFNAVELAAKRL